MAPFVAAGTKDTLKLLALVRPFPVMFLNSFKRVCHPSYPLPHPLLPATSARQPNKVTLWRLKPSPARGLTSATRWQITFTFLIHPSLFSVEGYPRSATF